MLKIKQQSRFQQARPRVELARGDIFKVRGGGPYFLTEAGEKIPLGVSGNFRFLYFWKQGAYEALAATSIGKGRAGSGVENIYVGRKRLSKSVDGMVLAPHRISKRRAQTVDRLTGKRRKK
jgi:hypothetical protein